MGNMRAIREHAKTLAAHGRYASFAERLDVLASRFESRAILELVERYRETGTAS
jgi:hypothetical protein